MFKVSEIISMPVISLFESEFQGIVYNIVFETRTKKCKFVCVLDEKEGIKKMLKISDIYQIGQDCIFVKNNSYLEPELNFNPNSEQYINPLNLQAYNLDGKHSGTSIDIELDDKYNISAIVLNSGDKIKTENIFNLGKTAILINNHNINIAKFKPKQKVSTTITHQNKVFVLSSSVEKESAKPIESIKTEKIITDFRFLVGRILNKDIVAINGEMIAKNGTTITKDIVNKASFYGKLVEIARYSNKKISN